MLIGITGRAGSGKATAADYLAKAHRFMPIAFASPLRVMLQTGLGLTDEHFTQIRKNEPIWIGKSPCQLLQTLRTDWGRNQVNRTLWINLAERALDLLTGLELFLPTYDSQTRPP